MTGRAAMVRVERALDMLGEDGKKIRDYLEMSEEKVPISVWLDLLNQLGDQEGVRQIDPEGRVLKQLSTPLGAQTFKEWWGDLSHPVQLEIFH